LAPYVPLRATGSASVPCGDICLYCVAGGKKTKVSQSCDNGVYKEVADMTLEMLKSKIHRATVTQAELHYVGSITIDETLMEAAGIYEYEKVQIADVDNGARFETYVIAGEKGSGIICLNGAAARMVSTGDKVIIMCYAQMSPEEVKENPPKVVFVDEKNRITSVSRYEKHGALANIIEEK